MWQEALLVSSWTENIEPGAVGRMNVGAGAGSAFGRAETKGFREASMARRVEVRREVVVVGGNNMLGMDRVCLSRKIWFNHLS
jgi:hypothetical protein